MDFYSQIHLLITKIIDDRFQLKKAILTNKWRNKNLNLISEVAKNYKITFLSCMY